MHVVSFMVNADFRNITILIHHVVSRATVQNYSPFLDDGLGELYMWTAHRSSWIVGLVRVIFMCLNYECSLETACPDTFDFMTFIC